MRKEKWKILQDAYGGPYADKDYNKEGLEELGRILKQEGVTQRIIDVSCFLFMKLFIYERAQTKIEMIVDAMRKNDGVVTLVFDIIQMYKWRYGLALFVRICKRKAKESRPAPEASPAAADAVRVQRLCASRVARRRRASPRVDHLLRAGTDGARRRRRARSEPPARNAARAARATRARPVRLSRARRAPHASRNEALLAQATPPPPRRASSTRGSLTSFLQTKFGAKVRTPSQLATELAAAAPGDVFICDGNADADAAILGLGCCFPGKAAAVTVDLDFWSAFWVVRPKQGGDHRYESWQLLRPYSLGLGQRWWVADTIDALAGGTEACGNRLLAPRNKVIELWKAAGCPTTFDAIAGLLHSVEDRTTLCGHALHQWYAPVTFAGGRGVGVLEFVVANATDQVAVDMATAALAFFAGSALFRAQLRECEPALRELERFRDLGAYRSPLLQKRPAALILQKLAQEYCQSAAAAAALADVVQREAPDLDDPALVEHDISSGASPLAVDGPVRDAVKRVSATASKSINLQDDVEAGALRRYPTTDPAAGFERTLLAIIEDHHRGQPVHWSNPTQVVSVCNGGGRRGHGALTRRPRRDASGVRGVLRRVGAPPKTPYF